MKVPTLVETGKRIDAALARLEAPRSV